MNHIFQEGQRVLCVSENFPLIRAFSGPNGVEASNTPKKGEVLVIDEILGEFLRFDKYDTEGSYNWWFYDRFSPIEEMEVAIEELIAEALSVTQ